MKTRLPNKGMKQTKPAQAMELRSLSPVFGRQSGVRRNGHCREAVAVHQTLEGFCGGAFDDLDPEMRIGELLPGNQATGPHRIERYQASGQTFHSREVVPRAIEQFAAQIAIAVEQLPAQRLTNALLGSTARHSTWDPQTIWSRSVRGVVNERIKHTGDCSCVEGRSRPTKG